jgi:hypothetical protein
MMKFRKILLILGIVSLASVFVINASFAASSEKLSIYKSSSSATIDKKVSTIQEVSTINNGNGNGTYKEYCKISIKKAYQKKYKIKSVNIRYSVYDNKTSEFKNYIYRNYTVNNKNNFVINTKINDYTSIDKLTVNYQTNGKIKKESTSSYYSKGELKFNSYLISIKANANMIQKISINGKNVNPFTVKYQKLKVVTKSKQYKIRSIKLSLVNMKNNKISYKTFKGYGKNNLKLQLYQNQFVQDIKVYYY